MRKSKNAKWQSPKADGGFHKITYIMAESEAFRSLSGKQKSLYLLCMKQLHVNTTPHKEFPEVEAFKGGETFFMTFKTVCDNRLYKQGSQSTFRRDMRALMTMGLIECISNGKRQYKMNVYKMSSKWYENKK